MIVFFWMEVLGSYDWLCHKQGPEQHLLLHKEASVQTPVLHPSSPQQRAMFSLAKKTRELAFMPCAISLTHVPRRMHSVKSADQKVKTSRSELHCNTQQKSQGVFTHASTRRMAGTQRPQNTTMV